MDNKAARAAPICMAAEAKASGPCGGTARSKLQPSVAVSHRHLLIHAVGPDCGFHDTRWSRGQGAFASGTPGGGRGATLDKFSRKCVNLRRRSGTVVGMRSATDRLCIRVVAVVVIVGARRRFVAPSALVMASLLHTRHVQRLGMSKNRNRPSRKL